MKPKPVDLTLSFADALALIPSPRDHAREGDGGRHGSGTRIPIMYWTKKFNPKKMQGQVIPSYLKVRAIQRMKDGERVLPSYKGLAQCRICGRILGATDMRDDLFMWPQLAEHYIEAHDVWFPMLEHFAIHNPEVACTCTRVAEPPKRQRKTTAAPAAPVKAAIDAEKLHRDLLGARKAAEKAIEGVVDGGTSNFDHPVLFGFGKTQEAYQKASLRKKAVADAIARAGFTASPSYGFYRGGIALGHFPGDHAQGNVRAKGADVVYEYMTKKGWRMGLYQQMD